jgi:hypothetical protein
VLALYLQGVGQLTHVYELALLPDETNIGFCEKSFARDEVTQRLPLGGGKLPSPCASFEDSEFSKVIRKSCGVTNSDESASTHVIGNDSMTNNN